jgi:hypothetical protein
LNYVSNKGGINIDGVPLTCDWADVVDEDDNNGKQIFVSGLDEGVDEVKLREVFSDFGIVFKIFKKFRLQILFYAEIIKVQRGRISLL